MNTYPISRTVTGGALLLAPLAGLVAAIALPALRSSRSAEITAIAQHPDRFYLYALAILISSYLLVPAFFALMNLLRDNRSGRSGTWSYLGAGLAQVGLLVAIGDAGTELMYWQMGSPDADHAQMTALAQRYDSATGVSLIYNLGGLAMLVGTGLVAAGLWRSRAVPRWTALGIAISAVANIAGFATARQPLLIASYLVMLAAFTRIAKTVLTARPAPAADPERRPAPTGAPAP